MKKKIVALCLVLALAITAIGGATLAYFTDNDAKTNTFTVGDVKIHIDEWKDMNDDGTWEEYTDKQELHPIAQTKAPANKIVETVNDGTEDAYIRTFVTCPKSLWNQLGYGFQYGTGSTGKVAEDILKANGHTAHKLDSWKTLGYIKIDGVEHGVFVCEHKDAIPAGDSIVSLTKVWVYDNVDNADIGDSFEVQVYSEAIQSANLSYEEAMKALDDGKTTLKHAEELFNK